MTATPPRLRLPLLERLLAPDDAPGGAPRDEVAALRESVRRDLEALLNTRRPALSWPASLAELDGSILAYGIGDVAGRHFASAAECSALCREVAAAITRFEPRLHSVVVTLAEGAEQPGRSVGLRIEAVLDADPLPVSLTLATQLDPALRRLSVQEVPH